MSNETIARVLDPHEEEGLKLIYSEIVKILYQIPTAEKVSHREVRLQVYSHQTGEHLDVFQIEIVDDADIFFHYLFKLNDEQFPDYQEKKELDVEFADFLNLTLKYIKGSQEEPGEYRMIFRIEEDDEESAHLILRHIVLF